MKILPSIIVVFWTIPSLGQGFLRMDTLNAIPTEVKGLLDGTFKKGLRVDFNGDGRRDYVLEVTTNDRNSSGNIEYWITSDIRTFKKIKKAGQDYDYFWFVNLDKDIEPEIFRATGYEDGIDYAIYDQDLSTGKEGLVSYVNPVIIEKGKTYWGYPWDITDVILKDEGDSILLRASFDHDIVRDGEITVPDPTKKFPAVFFYGHSTQPNIPVGQTRNLTWVLLESLR
jgi:hypothetical protein